MRSAILQFVAALLAAPALACSLPPQGEGRVAAVIDGRTLRLADGAEIRLAGIELMTDTSAALAAMALGRDVTLQGDSDMPDRYGRQSAFVVVDDGAPSLQAQLLAEGAALFSGTVADTACATALKQAETAARRARRGIWTQPDVIKNAESPGGILTDLGRFSLVEGRVTSVRQAGAMTYLNFGRRWTQDFAVTISRRMMVTLSGAGITAKSFEYRRIRIRGWIERRGGPRIEARHLGQIDVVGDD